MIRNSPNSQSPFFNPLNISLSNPQILDEFPELSLLQKITNYSEKVRESALILIANLDPTFSKTTLHQLRNKQIMKKLTLRLIDSSQNIIYLAFFALINLININKQFAIDIINQGAFTYILQNIKKNSQFHNSIKFIQAAFKLSEILLISIPNLSSSEIYLIMQEGYKHCQCQQVLLFFYSCCRFEHTRMKLFAVQKHVRRIEMNLKENCNLINSISVLILFQLYNKNFDQKEQQRMFALGEVIIDSCRKIIQQFIGMKFQITWKEEQEMEQGKQEQQMIDFKKQEGKDIQNLGIQIEIEESTKQEKNHNNIIQTLLNILQFFNKLFESDFDECQQEDLLQQQQLKPSPQFNQFLTEKARSYLEKYLSSILQKILDIKLELGKYCAIIIPILHLHNSLDLFTDFTYNILLDITKLQAPNNEYLKEISLMCLKLMLKNENKITNLDDILNLLQSIAIQEIQIAMVVLELISKRVNPQKYQLNQNYIRKATIILLKAFNLQNYVIQAQALDTLFDVYSNQQFDHLILEYNILNIIKYGYELMKDNLKQLKKEKQREFLLSVYKDLGRFIQYKENKMKQNKLI